MGSRLKNKESILDTMRPIDTVIREANVKIGQAIDGTRESYITRWSKINDAIDSIQEGEIIVIGGRPGSGKSAFANLLVQDIFDQHLNPFPALGLYFSLEMPAYQQIIRWYSNDQRMESKKILSSRNPIDQSTFSKLKETGSKLKHMNLVFHDTPLIPEAIANTVVNAIAKNRGKRIFLIVDHSRLVLGDADRERIKIEKLVEYCNTLKNKYGVISILLSQMNRDIEKERDRKRMGQSLPVMADLFAASKIGSVFYFNYISVMGKIHKKSAIARERLKRITRLIDRGYTNFEISKIENIPQKRLIKYLSEKKLKCNRYKNIVLTTIERQVIIGSLLGDGYIGFSGKFAKSATLKVKHSIKQKEYLIHKKNLLSRLVLSIRELSPRTVTFPDGHIVTSTGICFQSISHPIFTYFQKDWYKDVKIIGKSAKDIDALGLAIWYMDDGFCSKYECFFSTDCFKKEELLIYSNTLCNKFNIDFKLIKNKNNYRLRIAAADKMNFIRLIEPYVIEEMKYKLDA